jgi:hypothetical protein
VALPVLFFTFFGLPLPNRPCPRHEASALPSVTPRSRPYSVGSVMVFGFGIRVATGTG